MATRFDLFKYKQEIRKIIYTTNAVEALHRQFRKVTKSKSIFPNDDELKKMLFPAYRDLSKKWTVQTPGWAIVLSHLSVIFNDRISDVLWSNPFTQIILQTRNRY